MDFSSRFILAEAMGGSHAYGLSTPTSDVDVRGVFVNTDVDHLVGLRRDEVLVSQKEGSEDKVYTELRHALKLLRGANTQMVELLFTNEWKVLTPQWQAVMDARAMLVDTAKLFACLTGYMQGELRLANGERTGRLGGKRKASLDKYGFSPKNFVQLFRLSWCGQVYFQKGVFPVNVAQHHPEFAEELLHLKTHPEDYTREELNAQAEQSQKALTEAYDHRTVTTQFVEDVASALCLHVYGPLVKDLWDKK